MYDNGKEQNIQVDVTYDPISLVVAMECSGRVESILKQMKHVGSLVPTVIGVQGEAALVKFDGRDPMLVQDFTSDPDKIKVAIDKINPGSSGSRMIDAVDMSVDLLRHRAPHNRKIILLISETRDEGSSTRLREALIKANLSNVLVYCVDITQLAVRLTQRQDDPGPVPGMDPTTMPPTPLGHSADANDDGAELRHGQPGAVRSVVKGSLYRREADFRGRIRRGSLRCRQADSISSFSSSGALRMRWSGSARNCTAST